MARIALCMIVKDEARFLARCLESARGVVDEIVVVDTGSSDGSAEIAARHGARVLTHPWNDDFAAARNVALDAARADFVLQLDGDEELGEGAASAIRAAVREPKDAWLVRLHHAAHLGVAPAEVVAGRLGARTGDEQNLPRLFRATARYAGAIHEDIGEWLQAHGGRLGQVDADIVHWGRTAEIVAQKGKALRNQTMLRKAVASEQSLLYHGYLATELLDAGAHEEAAKVAEAGFARLATGSVPAHHSAFRVALVRLDAALRRGDLATVTATVEALVAREGAHRDLDHLLGEGHLAAAIPARGHARRRHVARAIAAFDAAIDKRRVRYAQAFVSGAGAEASLTQRGIAELLRGAPAAALADFDRALATRLDHRPARLGRAEALVRLARAEEALALLDGQLDDRPDGWLLTAAALETLGALPDMAACLRAARDRVPNGYLAPHRRRLHLDLVAAVAAYEGQPVVDDSPMGALGALLSRRPCPGEAAGITWPDAVALLDPLVPNLLALGHGAQIAALGEPRAKALVPGIDEALAAVAARRGWSVGDDGQEPSFRLEGDSAACAVAARVLGRHPGLVLAADGVLLTVDDESADAGLSLRALFSEPRRTLTELFARLGVPFHEAPLREVLTHEVES